VARSELAVASRHQTRFATQISEIQLVEKHGPCANELLAFQAVCRRRAAYSSRSGLSEAATHGTECLDCPGCNCSPNPIESPSRRHPSIFQFGITNAAVLERAEARVLGTRSIA
jgi:hypothetical protein